MPGFSLMRPEGMKTGGDEDAREGSRACASPSATRVLLPSALTHWAHGERSPENSHMKHKKEPIKKAP